MTSSVVIVGAGHAGFQLAASLRQSGHAGAITLINNEPYLPYQRPPLSKTYLKGPGGPDSVMFRPATFFADQRIDLVAGEVAAINRAAKAVRLTTHQTIAYGHLVLATGARNRALAIGDADVAGIRNLADTEALRARLPGLTRVTIVGAGFIGLEFAATARALGLEVEVIELSARAMARAVCEPVSAYFRARHEAAGVRFHVETLAQEMARRDGVVTMRLNNGEVIETDLVVAGVGVIPNIELAVEAGLRTASGVVVDAQLLTDDPDISAIGDCAEFPCVQANAPLRVESVQNATDQARCVAARLTGKPHAYVALPWFWSDQGSDKLQIVGLTAGYDSVVLRGDPADGAFSAFCYRGEQLLGIESVNRAGDHVVGRKLLGAGRNITQAQAADAGFDLKSLVG